MIFWIGDLNYRVQTSHEMTFEVIKAHADNFQIQTLLKHDQLLNEMKRNNVFWDFIEMPIDFKPTYKYDPGTNDWDSRYMYTNPECTHMCMGGYCWIGSLPCKNNCCVGFFLQELTYMYMYRR